MPSPRRCELLRNGEYNVKRLRLCGMEGFAQQVRGGRNGCGRGPIIGLEVARAGSRGRLAPGRVGSRLRQVVRRMCLYTGGVCHVELIRLRAVATTRGAVGLAHGCQVV